MVVGCNPSTADLDSDDPTVLKLGRWAGLNGYCGIDVANMFAFRETHPARMKAAAPFHHLVGPDNDFWISRMAAEAHDVVLAMGEIAFKDWRSYTGIYRELPRQRREAATARFLHVKSLIKAQLRPEGRLMAFGLTKAGHPRHVLYLPREMAHSGQWLDL